MTIETDARPAPPADLLADASLFLDFDGTLVEIAERPDGVSVDARLHALVRRLVDALGGRVAMISGRPVDQLLDLFGDAPGFAVAGSHGMEFYWPDGRRERAPRPAAMDEVLAEMHALAAANPGVLVEDKPLGVGLHYRRAPDAEAACRALATTLAERHGLHLQTGKMLYEVRTSGGDKGAALRTFMKDGDMAGTRPIFAGDDDTDEPAFVAADALGGAGILIGEDRESAARYRLSGVQPMLDWLESAAGAAA